MYKKAYGIIKTLAPLHVGAAAGEEAGNLNLIFRDQFTQTGIIPGSSLRGRFRAEMRRSQPGSEQDIYGNDADSKDGTTESLVKFEYASLVWLPVFCPGQPVVWVSCPRLLERYQRITGIDAEVPQKNTAGNLDNVKKNKNQRKVLFFNLGYLVIEQEADLSAWVPLGSGLTDQPLVVVDNASIGMIHDMALYRQSRVALDENEKKAKKGAFFDVEALPEDSVLVFPIAVKSQIPNPKNRDEMLNVTWQPFGQDDSPIKTEGEVYFGGLESIGFGHCAVNLFGEDCFS